MNCFRKQYPLKTVLFTIIFYLKIISTIEFNSSIAMAIEDKNKGSCIKMRQKSHQQSIPTEFVGFAQGDPYYAHDSILVQNGEGQIVEAKGYAVSLFYDISTAIQFRPVIQKGTGWGQRLNNGSWTGMPSQVLDPQYDACDNVLSITLSTLNIERVGAFTFLQPTYSTNYFVHFRPPPSTTLRNVFVQPFQPQIWQSIFLLSIVSVFILKTMYCYSKQDEDENSNNFSDLILWILANLCQTGWTLQPRSNSMRIVFFSFVLTTTILYIAYSATLVSIFSSNTAIKISDLSQLPSRAITIYADEAVPFINQIIQASKSNDKSKATSPSSTNGIKSEDSSISNSNQMNIRLSDAVAKVLTSKSAIVTLEGFYNECERQNLSLQEYCNNIYTIKISQPRRQAGMYVRRGWKYKEVFGKTTILIMERGLNFRYSQISNRMTNPSCGYLSNVKTVHLKIGFNDAITAFVLLVTGMGISFGQLILENIAFYLSSLYVLTQIHDGQQNRNLNCKRH